jgi:hypothetical protein
MNWKLRLGLALAVVIATGAASAQAHDEQAAVAVAAVRAARAPLPAGPTRVLSSKGMEKTTAAVARALGGDVTTLKDARPCGDLPSSCRLVDAVALVRVGALRIEADSATVLVELYWKIDSSRQPVGYKSVVVMLARDDGEWRVIDQRLREIA